MNKQIQVLYKIFELELVPPFELMESEYVYEFFHIYNKHSEPIGSFNLENGEISIGSEKESLIFYRIKQVFNVDTLSNEDAYHIAKHLVNWSQTKIIKRIDYIEVWNEDEDKLVRYRK